ncbi:MAG: PKD domain-containing protein, partial [Flavobacteriales bacterium]|nr:PKD domain-containing protein [Flavobacteriales bacterium]
MKKIYLLLVSILMLGAVQTNAQCSADFHYYSTGTNLTVQFVDTSLTPPGSAISYYWDFGTGSISGLQNPSYTYPSAGTYLACLTIYDSLSNCSDSVCYNITISNGQTTPCMASFTYVVNPNGVPSSSNSVNFRGVVTSGVAPFTYAWDFGVPGSPSPNAFSTFHVYSSAGTYGVTFTATDANGASCSYYDTIYVNTCTADFTYSANSNGVVNFTNQSNPLNAAALSISWYFGDGTNSSLVHPIHTYAASGTYAVTLVYYDSLSNCSAVYTDSVVVLIGAQNNCNASYTIAVDSSLAFGVILYNTSSNF